MQLFKFGFAALILSVIFSQPVFAQSFREEGVRIGRHEFKDIKGYRIGQASLKAGISTEGRYDSNVYLTSNNKKSDYISITSPKFLLDLPLGIDERHLVQLMYTADAGAFSDQKDQNYLNQNAAANIKLRLPFGYLNVNNDFKDTVDRAATEFTSQVHRKENKAQATLGIEVNKLSYELGYSNFIKRYYDKTYQNIEYNEDVVSGIAYYQLLPKTKALLSYDRGFVNYTKDSTRDSVYDEFMAGLKGELTSKVVGIVKAGYQTRNYDAAGQRGYNGFVSEAGLIGSLSERTELTLKYVTTIMESSFGNNNYYNANILSAELDQKLMGNFNILLKSGFSRNLYPESDTIYNTKRADSLISEGAALQYKFKDYGKVSLGYDYKELMSNIDAKAYNDNIVSMRFDLLM